VENLPLLLDKADKNRMKSLKIGKKVLK